MSGYLDRMAARAVGAPSGAEVAPRLPSRYEPAEARLDAAATDEAVLGTPRARSSVERGPAEPAPTPPTPRPATQEVPVPSSGRPTERTLVAHPPAHPALPTRSGPEPRDAAPPPPSGSEPWARVAAGVPADHPAGDAEGERAAARRPVSTGPAAPKVQGAVPAVPVAAAPPWPPTVERRERRPEPGPRQPDVVVVSVGRVEVRAATAAPPATSAVSTPAPRPPTAEGLSLHDYLRGQREVR